MKGMTTEEFDNFHDHAKCKWLDCAGGMGLAGHGHCSFAGDWKNPDCPEYVDEKEWEAKM